VDYATLKEALASEETIHLSSFDLLRAIAHRVNKPDSVHEGRDLVIRALAKLESFPMEEREVLFSLVRTVGLFPYLRDYLGTIDVTDFIAYELHRPDNMGEEIVFHSLQAKIYHELLSGTNVVLSAATSVGKSLIIDAVLATGRYRKIVIVVPTLALMDEIRRRLTVRFRDTCALITHPSQRMQPEKMNIYVLTQERVLQRDDLSDVDLFVIDEFYKMTLDGNEDKARVVDLNLAFQKLAKTGAQFYLLGPAIRAVSGLDNYEYHFIPSDLSTVAVDVVNFNLPTHGEARPSKLLELCRSLTGPTIIYCQSPGSASRVAQRLVSDGGLPLLEETSAAVEWISENYDSQWIVAEALKRGIGIHHGGTPRALQQYFIRLFNDRVIRHLVCTSTIIEGVNTVAENVIIYDRRKNKSVVDHFTLKNISGRAGRMNQYFIGKVFVLEEPPAEDDYSVEIPVGALNASSPLSLLLELDEDDLTPESREVLEDAFANSSLSQDTLRANRYYSIESQESLATALRAMNQPERELLTWSGTPSADQLILVCSLIVDHLEGHSLAQYRITSGESLHWHIRAVELGEGVSSYVRGRIPDRPPEQTVSDSIEESLRILRNVLGFRLPRALMAVDTIKSEVFSQLGSPSTGDYSYFTTLIESLFMPPSLYALDEYGIPLQTALSLASALAPAGSLDENLETLRTLDLSKLNLTKFEEDLLQDLKSTL
jgi:superfamily II DNA/RNA helicase